MLKGRLEGVASLESLREELEEKREPKRLAFSARETAIVPSAWKRGGKSDLQKFLEMLLAKDQELLVGVVVRLDFSSLQRFYSPYEFELYSNSLQQ